MLVLYHAGTAVCAIKVRLVLSEKGMEWTSRELNLRAGEQSSPDYLKLNPNAVVPTLVHDGRVLIESSVIMQYLDELDPATSLLPAYPYARAQMRLWMKFADEVVHPANITLIYSAVHRANAMRQSEGEREAMFAQIPDAGRRQRQRHAIELGAGSPEARPSAEAFAECLRRMDVALSGKQWLADDEWTLADAAITPYVDRLQKLGLEDLWVGRYPRVEDWLARIKARPSYQQAVAAYAGAKGPVVDKDVIDAFSGLAAA